MKSPGNLVPLIRTVICEQIFSSVFSIKAGVCRLFFETGTCQDLVLQINCDAIGREQKEFVKFGHKGKHSKRRDENPKKDFAVNLAHGNREDKPNQKKPYGS